MKRIRLSNGKYTNEQSITATIVQTNETGSIDRKYISKSKQKELKDCGFAYVNQRHERIV
jgi:hypothetical protein